jgi:putative oxidoreductase
MKVNSKTRKFLAASGSPVIVARITVGWVFLTEGIQKFLYPELLGIGRFEKIGFSNPGFWAPLTGTFEIICGTLILLGFLSRFASVPLIIVMITAFITAKIPILVQHGFWTFMHEYRTDFCMTMLLGFILCFGGGKYSIDRWVFRKPDRAGD